MSPILSTLVVILGIIALAVVGVVSYVNRPASEPVADAFSGPGGFVVPFAVVALLALMAYFSYLYRF